MLNRLAILIAVLISTVTSPVEAQDFPSRPITLVLPFAAGTASDTTTRIITDQVQKATGATIVIENRPGALGVIGTQVARRAPANGYTILMSSVSTHSLGEVFSKDLNYDPISDFTHIAVLTYNPAAIIVAADSPIRTVSDLVEQVRTRPGQMKYSYASGSTWVGGAKFHRMLDLKARVVPYKSSQDSLIDLLGGRLDYMISDSITAVASASGGQTRVLLVLGDEKLAALPDIPSMKEAGFPLIKATVWTGIAAPAGISEDARQWLRKNFSDALNDPSTREKLLKLSAQLPAVGLDPVKFVIEQREVWTEAAKEAGVNPQ
jgi:tripartite-type tricarboxylate transporter receptor subunit TctC